MSILGTFTGNGIAVVLYVHGHPAAAIAGLVAINLVCLAVTVMRVREPPAPGAVRPFALGPFVRSFWLPPALHRNFYRVLVTRLFANLGVWSVLTFLLFYLEDVVGVAEPGRILPMVLGIGALLGIPASLVAARLSARWGIVAIVRTTNWMMAGSAIAYVLIALHPYPALMAPVALVYFSGLGRLPGGGLGVGVAGAAEERDGGQGHGHLACGAGIAADSRPALDRMDHQRRQMGGLGALCLCSRLCDRSVVVQPVGAADRAGAVGAGRRSLMMT